MDASDFMIIGHRGAAGLEPENTLRSFRRALELGVDAIELDVHRVEDELVVIHDDTLERTTNGQGPVAGLSLTALRELDAGHGEMIPLLDEVLDLVGGRVLVNVELKGPGTASVLARKLSQRGTAGLLVSSFDHSQLLELHALAPEAKTAPLFGRSRLGMFGTARRLSAWSINVSRRLATAPRLRAIRRRGYRSLIYTVNDPAEATWLRSNGADGIFTDYPDRIRAQRSR
jgi:glycerophosphoryl diester phosphodiesterase